MKKTRDISPPLLARWAARARQMQHVLFLALLCFALAQTSIAETAWRNFPLGNWNISDNWSNGIPGLNTHTDISNGGTAFLNASAGLTRYLRVGVFSNTSGTLLVSETQLFAEVLQVGEGGGPGTGPGGTGTLHLSNGANAYVRSSGVGSDYGFTSVGAGSQATGSMTVTDPGTYLQSAQLVVGNGTSNGTLRIAGGAVVQNRSTSLGSSSGSTGAVTVTGDRSVWQAWGPGGAVADFEVAHRGVGSVLVSDRGTVISESQIMIGTLAGSNGTVTVTGAGSRWKSAAAFFVGGDYFTSGGSALLRIQTGGSVQASGLKLYHTGLILVENGSSSIAGLALSGGPSQPSAGGTLGDLVVGNTTSGRMEIRGGGTLLTNRGYMDGTGGVGSTLVTGAGSKWTASGSHWVGNSGAGALEITNGGALNSLGHGYLGFSVNASGSALVSGTGSTWTMAGNLFVGGNGAGPGGTGLLRIENGGRVNAATATIYNRGTLAGGGTLSAATVNNSGTVAPGNSAGRLTISGNYNQTSAGSLAIELGGYLPGTEHDQLAVSGSAIVGGTLNLTLVNGFRPNAGDTFQIIASNGQSGNFSTINCPGLTVRSDASPSGIVLTITGGAVDAVVTNTNDDGAGSLRAIITNAVAGCTIVFAANVGGVINLTGGEIVIDRDVTIRGPAPDRGPGPGPAGITINGNHASRVLRVTGSSTVTLSNLTIANGTTSSAGAGIYVDYGASLTLQNATVSGNASGNAGGGVANNGSFTAESCTFSGNSASGGGGGIYTYAGPVVLRNCTVVANAAGFARGGGLCNYSLVAGTSNQLTNTIVAGNSGAGHVDVIGVFTSGGYNLIGKMDYSTPPGGNTAGVPTSGMIDGVNHDQVGSVASPKDAMFGPLQDNGGSTFTHALNPGSPAVDHGLSFGQSTDQRGKPRSFDFPSIANAEGGDASDIGAYELSPPVEINFAAVSLSESTGQLRPDTMGAVGPAQFLVAVNGRLRTFNKMTGIPDGALDMNPEVFFASVKTPAAAGQTVSVGNPRVRYDRLSQRWFLLMIDFPVERVRNILSPNRILIAVSDGPVITGSASFRLFYFRQDQVSPAGDVNAFADFPSLGIDRNALYLGANLFTTGAAISTYTGTSAFVVRKSSLLAGGPLVATAFRGLETTMLSPQGADNFDPDATQGYFISGSSDINRLHLRRIDDPGGTPSISGDLTVTVPVLNDPVSVPQAGSVARFSAGDGGLAMAQIRNGRLWTVQTTGKVSSPTLNGVRWYELGDLNTTPVTAQVGTVFLAGAAPKHYFMPSIMVSGQGHAALGFSTSGLTSHPNAGFTSRLATDPPGTMHTPTDYTASTTTFKYPNWGLYSYTSLDPEDDMTMWTIQEYCDATDSWAVRVAKLSAPPPATPTTTSPASIPPGRSQVSVLVTGTSVAGSGFYDPGPGFAKRLTASVTGGVLVKRVTYHSPTAVTLDLDTTGASSGFADLTIVNPDDQSITAVRFLSIFTPPDVRIDPPSGGQIRISWTYPPELAATVTFHLEQTQDLVSWLPVNTTIANPTPGHYQIVVPLPSASRGYYRVVATAR